MLSLQLSLALLTIGTRLSFAQNSTICNAKFADVNSTSVASLNFNTAEISIHSWAVTVASPPSNDANDVETSIWYDPGNAPYDNDTLIGYDLCAFFISNVPANTNRLAQSSSGSSCGAMLPRSCQDALRARAAVDAEAQTKDVEDIKSSLPDICSSIAASFGDAENTWPEECREAFGEGRDEDDGYVGATITSMAVTGYNESGLATECTLEGHGKTFDRVKIDVGDDLSYDKATRTTWPILSVYMPVANPRRRTSIGNVYTGLSCLRPDSFSKGSRVSPELAAGTPYASGSRRAVHEEGVTIAALIAVTLVMSLL